MGKKKAPAASSEGGAPEWMVSYADMITIMMAFFVVLYATTSGAGKSDKGHDNSETEGKTQSSGGSGGGASADSDDNPAVKKVVRSLYDRFGPNWTFANCWVGGATSIKGRVPAEIKTSNDKHMRSLTRGAASGDVSLSLTVSKPTEYTVPGGTIYFDENSDALDDSQKNDLYLVAEDLAGKLQKIEIRGHASRRPLPPDSPFRDHWDLAYQRGRKVLQFLTENGVDPRRIRIDNAGDNEPTQAVSDPPFGEKNSRVEIRLLNEWIEDQNMSRKVDSKKKQKVQMENAPETNAPENKDGKEKEANKESKVKSEKESKKDAEPKKEAKEKESEKNKESKEKSSGHGKH